MKRIHAPHLNRDVVFGRKRPVASGLRMRFADYVKTSLPTPPSSCDYSPKAAAVISDIMGNDSLGDCVVAGGYHIVGVETGNAGSAFHATRSQWLKDYEAIGGYVPGNPATDNGCDEQTALNYWMEHGFVNGTKLLGWLAVDATNKLEVQQAMFLFENLFFGVELPDAWVDPFPAGDGFVWGKAGAPIQENGHCFVAHGYDTSGAKINTWGLKGTLTYDAIAMYASKRGQGELYVMLTPDQLTKGQTKAPNGVDWAYLIADFNSLGGNVPVPGPAPAPVPPPGPAPVGQVTLAQATAWALATLHTAGTVLTRTQAEAMVTRSLASHWPKP